MTLDQMKYFFEAARFQHVGKAAKSAHISPSAISSAIASLESELDVDLFQRLGKSMVLTDAGKQLRTSVEKILNQIEEVKKSLNAEEKEFRGTYRLGASHFLGPEVLTKAVAGLQRHSPRLSTEISSLPTAQVIQDVLSGELDLGLCFSPFRHPELSQSIVHEGQLVVVVRKNHPLTKRSGRGAVEMLTDYPAVIHKGRPGVELCDSHPIFARYGVIPDIRLQFDDDACAMENVQMSDAWTLVPEIVALKHAGKTAQLFLPRDCEAPYSIAFVVGSPGTELEFAL